MSKRKPPRPSVHRLPTKLVESAGHRYLEQLLEPPEVDPHPDEIRLREWLSSDLIEGKFTRHWHRNIALAKELRIELSPFWDALASLLDRVFPRTCNVFNPFDPRDPVTEELLYPHLEKSHGLSLGECKKLRLDQLVCLLQQDVEGGPDRILDDEGPPDELLANLTKLERRMVEFVWDKTAEARHKFEAHVWEGKVRPQKKSVERAVERCEDHFVELREPYSIEINDEFVKFDRG